MGQSTNIPPSDSYSAYFEMNRCAWDDRARIHYVSQFYDVEGFLKGRSSLREIELSALKDVANKRLLHLQCHFGLDTLSWARAGALCTGVDISPVAIDQARGLVEKSGVYAEFLCADVYSFQRTQPEPFDIVFTSYGAICWLPDLDRWAAQIANNLAVDGRFYMVEFHPAYDIFAGYSYFTRSEPDIDEEGSYTENGADTVGTLATWAHPLSSVINALIGAGIRIESVREFPFSPYNCFEGMVERESGRFFLGHKGQDLPLVYSIQGRKDA